MDYLFFDKKLLALNTYSSVFPVWVEMMNNKFFLIDFITSQNQG